MFIDILIYTWDTCTYVAETAMVLIYLCHHTDPSCIKVKGHKSLHGSQLWKGHMALHDQSYLLLGPLNI